MKLNLGAGGHPIPGYENWDRKTGQEAYPLELPESSAEVIRASHVLEHFSHLEVSGVVNHWVSKLAPGGCLKIAVPDFEWIAKNYLAGEPINVQGYTMGGHSDDDDHHGVIFDRESLAEIMVSAGLERIGRWTSEVKDCASLPVSLNLMGFRPVAQLTEFKGVSAILSAPRWGPTAHQQLIGRIFSALRMNFEVGTGAYWHEVLSEQLENALARGDEFLITVDYDSIFSAQDVLELYRLMRAFTDADAACAVQEKRHNDTALFGMLDKNGEPRTLVPTSEFERHLTPISTGHFGLTMFRASSLAKLPRPWMVGQPNHETGRWKDGHVDPDIEFWHKWRQAGLSLHLANRVVIGHMQEMISWPGEGYKPVYQSLGDYRENGIPASVSR